jgi:hypothetical protein
MDRLEEQIRKNRRELDLRRPSPAVWRRVRKELGQDTFPVRRWLSVAAVFLAIIGTAITFFTIGHSWNGSKMESRFDQTASPSGNQLKETEIYYSNIINSLYREAAPLLTSHPDIDKELTDDISHLDSIYLDIKKDLRDNVANQDVIEALIQNYRIRIKILDDMLNMLKEENSTPEKNKRHEI